MVNINFKRRKPAISNVHFKCKYELVKPKIPPI